MAASACILGADEYRICHFGPGSQFAPIGENIVSRQIVNFGHFLPIVGMWVRNTDDL
jgi:hypothetical protein